MAMVIHSEAVQPAKFDPIMTPVGDSEDTRILKTSGGLFELDSAKLKLAATNTLEVSPEQLWAVMRAPDTRQRVGLDWLTLEGIGSCLDIAADPSKKSAQVFLRANVHSSFVGSKTPAVAIEHDGRRAWQLTYKSIVEIIRSDAWHHGIAKDAKKALRELFKTYPESEPDSLEDVPFMLDATSETVDGMKKSEIKYVKTMAKGFDRIGAKKRRLEEIEDGDFLRNTFLKTQLPAGNQVVFQINGLAGLHLVGNTLIGTKVEEDDVVDEE